jgi:cytoskeletal protein CcmA (bactofilin family)
VVFRRDSKVDAFQRQISALRNQLGGEPEDDSPRESGLVAFPRDNFGAWHDLASFQAMPDLQADSPRTVIPASRELESLDTTLPAVPAVDELTSVLSHTTTWVGNLDSTGSLHVHGRVEGSLVARDSIYVAEEAEIDAAIQATTVTVAGSVRGTIHCSGRFELLPRGRVAGDVHAPIVVIHDGALLSGEIDMTGEAEANRSSRTAARAARSAT